MKRFLTKTELIEYATNKTGINFKRLDEEIIDFLLWSSGYEYIEEEIETDKIPRDKAPVLTRLLKNTFYKFNRDLSDSLIAPSSAKSSKEVPRSVNITATFENKNSLLMEWELRSILTAQEFEEEASSWRAKYLSSEQALSEEEAITWLEEQEQKQSTSSDRFGWIQVNIFRENRTCLMVKVYAEESSLRYLAILASRLKDKNEWKEWEAVKFILLGHIPFIQPIEVSTSWSIESRRAFINLKIDHSVQPQEVAAYYKKAVQKFSAKGIETNSRKEALKQGRNKMKKDIDLPRFEKLIQETPDKTYAERAVIWDKKYPGDPMTKYKFENMVKNYMQIMKPTKSRSRRLDDKTLTLARFFLATPDIKGSDRVKEWNKTFPNYKIGDDDVNVFSVALHRVKKKFTSSFRLSL